MKINLATTHEKVLADLVFKGTVELGQIPICNRRNTKRAYEDLIKKKMEEKEAKVKKATAAAKRKATAAKKAKEKESNAEK